MTGEEFRRRKSNEFSLPCVRASMRCTCYVDGCRDCLVAPFGWRCVATWDREPPSPCVFPCEHGSGLQGFWCKFCEVYYLPRGFADFNPDPEIRESCSSL